MNDEKKAIEILLRNLPANGQSIGNIAMTRIFETNELTQKDYTKARAYLLNENKIVARRGRGGAIALSLATNGSKSKPGTGNGISTASTQNRILKYVPSDGASIGNIALIRKLERDGITSDAYWVARNELIRAGKLVMGRGMGGSVSLSEKSQTGRESLREKKFPKEKDLYVPFEKTLKEYWIKENNIEAHSCIVEITAHQGGKPTGGKWTRPDLTIIAINKYQYMPLKNLEVITFEIKPANYLDIIGVYETASHSRFATRSILAIHLPEGIMDTFQSLIDILAKECRRFGVGLMYFKDPSDPETWDTILEPMRIIPDPAETDEFISRQLSRNSQNAIRMML